MTSPNKKIKWIAEGKKLDTGGIASDRRSTGRTDEHIVIKEDARNVHMDDGDQPYGLPIDAPLAIELIRRFLSAPTPFFQMIDPAANKQMLEGMSPEVAQSVQLMAEAFNASYGVTFDRNIILKILSQTGCEGIRSYLCLSEPEQGTDWNPGNWSLVLVGVDAQGNDLHYQNYDPSIADEENTGSLTAEYGHPPGGGNGILVNGEIDDRYHLLKLAYEMNKQQP